MKFRNWTARFRSYRRRNQPWPSAITNAEVTCRPASWMASYTHSRALSNAVLNVFNDEPLQATPYLHPMPWDSPNRALAWAYAPSSCSIITASPSAAE